MNTIAHRSLDSCAKSDVVKPPTDRQGFTLIEMIIAISVISMLSLLVLATLGTVKSAAKSTACLSNVRQIQVGIAAFAAINDGKLLNGLSSTSDYDPAYPNFWGRKWYLELKSYVDTPDYVGSPSFTTQNAVRLRNIFFCSEAFHNPDYEEKLKVIQPGWNGVWGDTGYGYIDRIHQQCTDLTHTTCNQYSLSRIDYDTMSPPKWLDPWIKIQSIQQAPRRVLLFDYPTWMAPTRANFLAGDEYTKLTPQHRGRGTTLFFDGHAAQSTVEDIRNGIIIP